MNKYFQTITNARGDSLPGYRMQVVDSSGAIVPIFADGSSTQFVDAAGTAVNYATASEAGKVEFYWTAATGQVLQVLDLEGNLQDATTDFADNIVLDNLAGDVGSANVSFAQSGIGAVTRTAQSKLTDTVSVKDYGAVGDGTTDDTAAFTAALTAHKRVLVPEGTYSVSTIDIDVDGCELIGIGFGTVLQANSSGPIIRSLLANRVVSGKSLEGVCIQGIYLDGNDLATNCLQLERFTRRCAVRECRIESATADGVDVSESWSFVFSDNYVARNGARGAYFHATNTDDTDGLNAFVMTGNWFSLNGAEGVRIISAQAGVFSGNTSEYNGGTNAVFAGRSLQVTGNYFEGFSSARTATGGEEYCVILGTADLRFLRSIFNNYVNGGSVSGDSFDGDGVALRNVVESEVRGSFSQSTRYPYAFDETWQIIGNEINIQADQQDPSSLRAATLRNLTQGVTGGLEVLDGADVFANRNARIGDALGIREDYQIEPNGTQGSLWQQRIIESGAVLFDIGKRASGDRIFDFSGSADVQYRFQRPLRLAARLDLDPSTPTTLASSVNNYALSVLPWQRLSSSTPVTISGFESSALPEAKWITNVGANNITLAHESTSSTAVNRISRHDAADLVLGPGRSAFLQYDTVQERWTVGLFA